MCPGWAAHGRTPCGTTGQAVQSVRTTLSGSGVLIKNLLREEVDSTLRRSGGRGGAEQGWMRSTGRAGSRLLDVALVMRYAQYLLASHSFLRLPRFSFWVGLRCLTASSKPVRICRKDSSENSRSFSTQRRPGKNIESQGQSSLHERVEVHRAPRIEHFV